MVASEVWSLVSSLLPLPDRPKQSTVLRYFFFTTRTRTRASARFKFPWTMAIVVGHPSRCAELPYLGNTRQI